jgi:hypothetical protein
MMMMDIDGFAKNIFTGVARLGIGGPAPPW